MPTHSLSPLAELRGLQQQVSGLQGGLLPRIGALQRQAAPPLHRVMRYAETAAEYAPQISGLLDQVLRRGPPAEGASGLLARAGRHRVLLTGLAIAAGLLAYDVWGDRLKAIARD